MTLTADQRLLLHAALLDGTPALDAWQQWRHTTDLDHLDQASGWLLPLLYRNLQAHGVDEAHLVRYHNVYRHNWYKNHLLIRIAANALRACDGGDVILLKGMALALCWYDDLGTRPLHQVDLIVNSETESGLTAYLCEAGWSTSRTADQICITDALGRQIVVHSHLMGLNDTFRSRTIPVMLQDVAVSALGTADQLTHLQAHRTDWDTRSSLLWAADLVTLLHRGEGLSRIDALREVERWLAPTLTRT